MIIKFEAYKTRYYNRTTNIKRERQHTYLQANATLFKEGKVQTKHQHIKHQQRTITVWFIISHILNSGFQEFKHDTLM